MSESDKVIEKANSGKWLSSSEANELGRTVRYGSRSRDAKSALVSIASKKVGSTKARELGAKVNSGSSESDSALTELLSYARG
jgi:hypothetical protein